MVTARDGHKTSSGAHDGDAALDAVLNTRLDAWRATALSRTIKARVTRELVRQTARRAPLGAGAGVWPWPPLRLAGASLAAAALGCALSFAVPLTAASADDIAVSLAVAGIDDLTADNANSVDMLALLW